MILETFLEKTRSKIRYSFIYPSQSMHRHASSLDRCHCATLWLVIIFENALIFLQIMNLSGGRKVNFPIHSTVLGSSYEFNPIRQWMVFFRPFACVSGRGSVAHVSRYRGLIRFTGTAFRMPGYCNAVHHSLF